LWLKKEPVIIVFICRNPPNRHRRRRIVLPGEVYKQILTLRKERRGKEANEQKSLNHTHHLFFSFYGA
jgi:hypothetical protein